MSPEKMISLDDIDHEIIRMLQEDGRRSYSNIAEELHLAPSTVQQRATRLLDSGLLTIKAIIHPADLDSATIALVAIKTVAGQLYAVSQELSEIPEVRWTVMCSGVHDILIEVVCQDNQHLLDLLAEKIAKVEGVRETVSFLYLGIVKRAQEWRFPTW